MSGNKSHLAKSKTQKGKPHTIIFEQKVTVTHL